MKILVVDDHADFLQLAEIYCKQVDSEAQVFTAMNGEEGFIAYAQHRPDLVITDYKMPILNGGEMVAKIHRKFGRTIPTMLVTSDKNEVKEPELFDDIISKGSRTLFIDSMRYVLDM